MSVNLMKEEQVHQVYNQLVALDQEKKVPLVTKKKAIAYKLAKS